MSAFLKQFATLMAGRMSGSNNKATFIVKSLRTTYVLSGTAIAVIWYSAWRNERVAPGEIKFPFPGLKKMPRKFTPDRPEKELPGHKEFGTSVGTLQGKNLQEIMKHQPNLLGIPQTPAEARAYQGTGYYEGKQVAMWIIPYLNYAKIHGWRGTVTSGYRTYQEEVQIYKSGVRPAAVPGHSNHGKKNFPGGAVDVTEAPQLAKILGEIPGGTLLRWAGAQDPVHFSYPHNGSY